MANNANLELDCLELNLIPSINLLNNSGKND